MAASVSVSNLAVVGGQNQFTATWDLSDGGTCLPDLLIDQVELWASADNDRSNASKVAEGITTATYAGLSTNLTRYFWIKARDQSGNESAWHPSSATGGVSATTKYIQTADIEDGAVTVAKLDVDELSAISADFGSATFTGSVKSANGTSIRLHFTSGGGPGGEVFYFD